MSEKRDQQREKENLKGIDLSGAGRQIQSILDALPFYVLLVDSEHRIIAANRKVAQDFESGPQRLAGAYCPVVIHGSDFPIAKCPLVEACKKGEVVERELHDAGKGRWMRAAVFPTPLVSGEGRPVYLHFAHDITGTKQTEEKLSQSLEHHSALSGLLQSFQYCQTSAQILNALIEQVVSLSWLGITTTAVGFLARDGRLDMAVEHNVAPGQLTRCESVKYGECLCGRVAQTGRSIVCSSSSSDHVIRYDGMREHSHAVLPISHEERVLGVLTLYLKPGDQLNGSQLDFLHAAITAAGAALAAQSAREEVKRVREKSMAHVIAYEEDERKRIARELHDQVCQSLSALLLEIQSHGSLDAPTQKIQRECQARIRDLIDEVRRMAGELRPTILDDYGLEMALARHIEDLSSSTGLAIDYQYVSCPEQGRRLPAPLEIGLYRVAIEALSNVICHARASRASVIVMWQNAKLMLLVEDDGCGFDYFAARRDLDRCLGLIGMEERIALMGGTFRIESASGKGTIVRAEIPIDKAV